MALQITVDTARAALTVKALRRLPTDIRRELGRELRAAATDVARHARALLRRGRGTASAPGAPPARQTGLLARSIRVRRARRDGLAYQILAVQPYALFLEAGTQSGGRRGSRTVSGSGRNRVRRSVRIGGTGRLAPRPFLTLALEEKRRDVQGRVADAIVAALETAAYRK